MRFEVTSAKLDRSYHRWGKGKGLQSKNAKMYFFRRKSDYKATFKGPPSKIGISDASKFLYFEACVFSSDFEMT